MKYFLVLLVVLGIAGCNEGQQKRKAFNVQDLKLGMQKYQVESICNGSLEFVAMEVIPDSNGHSKTTYRMWPNKPKNWVEQRFATGKGLVGQFIPPNDRKPYQVTFIADSVLTKERCEQIIEQEKITDPNTKLFVRTFEGYRFEELIGVSLDTEQIKLQVTAQQHQEQMYQQQQTLDAVEKMRQEAAWNQMTNQSNQFLRDQQQKK
jgi:hypothetical protein